MFCGTKTFTSNLAWVSVLVPADPSTTQLQLQVATNDYLLTGAQTLSLVVGFANALYTNTLTETITINMISPCTQTTISASAISDISFSFGTTTALVTPYTDFTDSVSTQYGVTNLCALVYSLSLAADATTYGVSLVTGLPNSISVLTTNGALKGTQIALTMSAVATPAQAIVG
jgi:hypothetical protein